MAKLKNKNDENKKFEKVNIKDVNSKELHESTPREQIGAVTGARYEYQYQRNAVACLGLLEDSDKVCVYCEWHDDFVVEKNCSATAKVLYAFTQVKTRDLNQGPWNFAEVFGVNSSGKRNLSKTKDSFFYKLIWNYLEFGATCEKLIFLTNNAVEPLFSNFFQEIDRCESWNELGGIHIAQFNQLYSEYSELFSNLSKEIFFSILKKFECLDEIAPFKDSHKGYSSDLMEKIRQLSEIDLNHRETERIGTSLLKLVRKKAHTVVNVKKDKDDLKKIKGVQINEVLDLLSLSYSGYEALKNGGDKDTVLKLSRLESKLKKANSNISDKAVKEFCELKICWDSWERKIRHDEHLEIELLSLKRAARLIYDKWTSGKIDLERVNNECLILSRNFSGKFDAIESINDNIVFGAIMAIASEVYLAL
jgi:hypothetical protein